MYHLFMFSGYSKSGKDEACKSAIQNFKAVQIGMTDPARRHFMQLYEWDSKRMFGDSEYRNSGDPSLPKESFTSLNSAGFIDLCPDLSSEDGEFFKNLQNHMKKFPCLGTERRFFSIQKKSNWFKWDHGYDFQKLKTNLIEGKNQWIFSDHDPNFFLSAREALQGHCENMNSMFENTWVSSVFKTIEELIYRIENGERVSYHNESGIIEDPSSDWFLRDTNKILCLNDLRHWHEIRYSNSIMIPGLKVTKVRIKRPSVPNPPFNHRSETEQSSIPDSEFDFIINNDSTLEEFHNRVVEVVRTVINL